MNKHPPPSDRHRSRQSIPLFRLAVIGAVVAAMGGAFVYASGFAAPQRLTPQRIVNTFEANAGVHPGFRRNHAKGVCVEGYFEGNGQASDISSASVFTAMRTPVVGRFAIPGSNPSAPDASVPVRSLALDFKLPDGQQWRTGMNNTPVFIVNTPQAFFAQLVALQPDPATGKPDPAKLKTFFAAHPETQPFQAWVKNHPPSSSFGNAAYYGINAFRAIDASGKTHFIRWSMVPEAQYSPVTADQKGEHDFLDAELRGRLANGPLRWHLVLTVAQPGDVTNDATQAWPEDRPHIDAGTLVIERETPQADGDCRDINYDPTILPTGLKPSDDPLLAARSSAYAVSYNRRTHEEARAQVSAQASSQASTRNPQ
ncbi:catalase [Caballeronia sordidicola]|uniref:Catalase-related peroxidase n=1 Tax=Caballeronia sordidicola TaxID=196367 RepID=A0A158GUE8_CABSO|nr:catalase family peroxidase [Caballeronia sordidicola]SAL35696.1 catalase [Caballeronia sordidicola]